MVGNFLAIIWSVLFITLTRSFFHLFFELFVVFNVQIVRQIVRIFLYSLWIFEFRFV